MLTESFVASVLSSGKGPADAARKDVGIVLHTYQPLPAQKSAFKKSSSPPNCLAVSDSHIFAAQAEKAVVHVYSRERGNQEAVVPFPEKISSLTLVGRRDGPGVLVMGTEGGRLLMWEVRRLCLDERTWLIGQSSFALAAKSQVPRLISRRLPVWRQIRRSTLC